MRLLACAGLTAAFLSAGPLARAERRERPRPTITTTTEGHDLRIVVHQVTDYCSTDAETQVLRTNDAIRILHDRPHHVSRCVATKDLTFLAKDVGPGRYTITYERTPLVAPARPLIVAATTTFVR